MQNDELSLIYEIGKNSVVISCLSKLIENSSLQKETEQAFFHLLKQSSEELSLISQKLEFLILNRRKDETNF